MMIKLQRIIERKKIFKKFYKFNFQIKRENK